MYIPGLSFLFSNILGLVNDKNNISPQYGALVKHESRAWRYAVFRYPELLHVKLTKMDLYSIALGLFI